LICKKRVVSSQRSKSLFPACIPMSEFEFATLSSLFVLGGFIGALTSGPLSSKRGKLSTMHLTSVLFLIGSILQALAGKLWVMGLGRFIIGLGAGASTVVVPIYIAEIAPQSMKGAFGSLTQISINIGILVTQVFGYFFSRPSVWRIILSLGAFLGFLHFVGLFFASESTAWKAGRKGIHDELMQDEPIEPLLRHPSHASTCGDSVVNPHMSMITLFRDSQYLHALIAVGGIMAIQQFTGINGIMLYSVGLLKGLLPVSSSLLTIMISIVNIAATVGCAHLPDKIGRKACLLMSISGMGAMSLLLALSLRWSFQYGSAIAVLGFVASFAAGLGPVPFSMASEMISQEGVGALQSWGLSCSYVSTFIVAQTFPIVNTYLNARLGGVGWVFFFFAGTALLSVLFVIRNVPETKGKSVDEIWGREERLD
jgi:sugar porter (SP) family MFS transporter